MRVAGVPHRSIWVDDSRSVFVLDQSRLPHEFAVLPLRDLAEAAHAIRSMQIRGAPLIGVTAAYGLALAMRADPSDAAIAMAAHTLKETRPTAVNLAWAVDAVAGALQGLSPSDRVEAAWAHAGRLADEDVETCRRIGEHGYALLAEIARKKGRVNVLTHCNAGWLATVDWGTALAPIFMAHDRGIDVHVWADETRPRSQGYLTAWELMQHGVPHTLIVDNIGGHIMQHGEVDLCIVGTDRTTRRGDVCNKIGTYLKALAAHDNGVPFYAAVPSSSIDWALDDGVREIPIEERDAREVHQVVGRTAEGRLETVTITPAGVRTRNFGFDVTPARLVTGLITDRGVCAASREGLLGLYPERA